MLRRAAFVVGAFLLTSTVAGAAAADVAVSIDASKTHQTWFGFGATTLPLVYNAKDNVPADLRTKAIEALYRDVQLTTGNLEVAPYESPPTALYSPANDNADPNVLDPAGFNFTQSDNAKTKVVDLGAPFGFGDWYLHASVNTLYELAWADGLRSSDRSLFLDECGEHVFAGAKHWRDAYGATPELIMPFNEPESGNREFGSSDPALLVDAVARIGGRLRKEGFATMKMVVPNEETESLSYEHAKAILDDASAAPFVGAIGYHPYPYGSTYASIPNILATSGAGAPDPTAVAARGSLRDLAKARGVMLFMTEVSHGELDPRTFDAFRGRAIQIHDDMVYADVNAFFGMNAMWDTTSHAEHFAGRDPGFWSGELEGDVVKIDNDARTVTITDMGRAIGQYARFLRRGDVRVEATSDDVMVQVVAFVRGPRTMLFAINNAAGVRKIAVKLVGGSATGALTGEQSTSTGSYWAPLAPATLGAGGSFDATLPALSVTTFALGDATSGDAGADASTDGGVDAGKDGATSDVGGDTRASGDANVRDGGADGSAADGGGDLADGGGASADAGSSGGCGCETASPHGTTAAAAVALAGLAALSRRRRREASARR